MFSPNLPHTHLITSSKLVPSVTGRKRVLREYDNGGADDSAEDIMFLISSKKSFTTVVVLLKLSTSKFTALHGMEMQPRVVYTKSLSTLKGKSYLIIATRHPIWVHDVSLTTRRFNVWQSLKKKVIRISEIYRLNTDFLLRAPSEVVRCEQHLDPEVRYSNWFPCI